MLFIRNFNYCNEDYSRPRSVLAESTGRVQSYWVRRQLTKYYSTPIPNGIIASSEQIEKGGDLGNSKNDEQIPRIQWDGSICTITLPMSGGGTLTAEWQPDITYAVRIKEANTQQWSVGFETPVGGSTFRHLKPDTEYEVEIAVCGSANDLEPVYIAFRTDPAGQGGEVIPFPKR